jgi:hypothetical protein
MSRAGRPARSRRSPRPQLLGRGDQRDQRQARPGAGPVRPAPPRRGLPVYRRRALRARARRGRDPQPSGVAGDRHRLGRPAQRSCGRTRQAREPFQLARLSAPAARARAVRRRVRRVGRPCRAPPSDRRGLPEAAWQRCAACPRAGLRPDPWVHFLRDALDYVPHKVDDDCLRELRWLGACPRAAFGRPGGPARFRGGPARSGGVAWQVAGDLSQALLLGRGAHRTNADFLPAAAPAPPTPEVDQPARASERGDQAAHPRRPHLSQRRGTAVLRGPGAGSSPQALPGTPERRIVGPQAPAYGEISGEVVCFRPISSQKQRRWPPRIRASSLAMHRPFY